MQISQIRKFVQGMRFLRQRRGGIVAPVAALLLGCAATNKYYDPNKPHHTPQGFRNNYLQGEIGGSFLKWQWERITQHLPMAPANGYRFPIEKPDLAWLQSNRAATTATWIGHATMLMQVAGVNIITDPMLSERASPFKFIGPQRKVPPALDYAQLPRIDIVLISHNHYDHLDRDTVLKLNEQAGGPPLFLVPLGIKAWMAEIGITNVRELDWWDKTEAHGLTLHFVPVQHWSARSFNDRFKTLWGGWVAKTGANAGRPFSFFFAGDTGYSKDFADIRQRLGGFDLALIPIGAYAPRWFMAPQHVDPGESVRIHRDIGARQSIAIHWGTFEMSDEPLDEPPRVLTQELKKADIPPEKFAVLRHGEMMRF
jgi:L-ascorbate metabolism protein UlaG (beta-lactamase superfamily)